MHVMMNMEFTVVMTTSADSDITEGCYSRNLDGKKTIYNLQNYHMGLKFCVI